MIKNKGERPNARLCGKATRSGKPCRHFAVKGKPTCYLHGSGSPKRVKEGKRKPAGRPITTGKNVNPATTGYTRFAELVEQFENDPNTRDPKIALAAQRAAIQFQFEKLLAGEWDLMKNESLPEDPMSWFAAQNASLVDRTVKVQSADFKDIVRASLELMRPVLGIVQDAITRFVPGDQQGDAREFFKQRVSALVIPK